MNAADVVEFLMAGASAVQLGSVLIDQDIEAFGVIGNDLEAWCKGHNVKTLDELVGAALP